MKMENFNLNDCMDYKRRKDFLKWLKKFVKSKKKEKDSKNSSANFSIFKYIRFKVNNLDYEPILRA
jgi:hypothetical protein